MEVDRSSAKPSPKVSLLTYRPKDLQSPEELQHTCSAQSHTTHMSVTHLSNDVWAIVFDLLQQVSPHTLHVLVFVCRDFYRLADYARHRSVSLHLHDSSLDILLNRLSYIERQNLLPAIRTLHIKASHYTALTKDIGLQFQPSIDALAAYLPCMSALKSLYWNYDDLCSQPIPNPIFQALHLRPIVQLHTRIAGNAYSIHLQDRDGTSKAFFSNLQSVQNLRSLMIDIEYTAAPSCLEVTASLKSILLSSHNLRSLSISIGQPNRGCVRYAPPKTYCGLDFHENESLPPLRELVIKNYPWGNEYNAYPYPKPEIHRWAHTFDWSHLQRLETGNISFMLEAMPHLTSLSNIEYLGFIPTPSIIDFFIQCPSKLEVVAVPGLGFISIDGIQRHGPTLKELHIHRHESWNTDWNRQALDAHTLQSIRDSCPNLEELSVDLARAIFWPWATLKILATYPKLKRLNLWFALKSRNYQNPIGPYVTFSTVKELLQSLKSHCPEQRLSLEVLKVSAGRPYERGYHDVRDDSIEFTCTLSERDDEAAYERFNIEVTYPRLRKGFRKGEDPTEEERERYFQTSPQKQWLRLAHKGPRKSTSYGVSDGGF